MARELPRTLVVGCGVSGLTTALCLQEAGFPVEVITRELPEETTSAVAAAIWHPFLVGPQDRALGWGRITLEKLFELSLDPACGIHRVPTVELFDAPVADPWWHSAVLSFRRARGEELTRGGHRYADGYAMEVAVAETPTYLPYLLRRFTDQGGRVEVRPEGVASLEELAADGPQLLVCCAGLGAHRLTADTEIFPIRGQVVVMENPGLDGAVVDEDGPWAPAYVIPRHGDCVVGGTAEHGVWETEVVPELTEEILTKGRALEPRLRDAAVREVKVGLRPGRTGVRLEIERPRPGLRIVHNYGHGGAGYTLSWGCALEAVELARRCAEELARG